MMDDMGELQSEELQDFLTNFQFPWEEASSEKKSTGKPLPKSSRRSTISDTTPARRTRPLSGKILSEDFLDIIINSSSPVESKKPKGTIEEQGSYTGSSQNVSDETFNSDSLHDSVSQEAKEPCTELILDNQGKNFISDSSESLSSEGENNLPRKVKKKRRQSCLIYKKKESLALLKTIGEIISPNNTAIVLTPPSELLKGAHQSNDPCTAESGIKPARKAKKRARSSHRSSRRLSGIGGPMLELGADGIPKLLKLEEIYAPQDDPQNPEHALSEGGSKDGSLGQETDRTMQGFPSPMETEMIRGTLPGHGVTETGAKSANLNYRTSCPSPLTPLVQATPESPEDSEYRTPKGLTLLKEPLRNHCCTPDSNMLGSFEDLKLELAESGKLKTSDGCALENLTEISTRLSHGEAEENHCSDNRMEVMVRESQILTPDSIPEEFATPRNDLLGEIDGASEMDEDSPMNRVANKENLASCDSPLEDDFAEIFDKKVKDLYLKKGQVGPKKNSTNLETVFEEQGRGCISVSRRKFKRSLAFPDKPWEARKGTKGKKMKKKRYSLMKTAKKNDPVLQQRLNFILNDIAEDSC